MKRTEAGIVASRRRFLESLAAILRAWHCLSAAGQLCPVQPGTVRDRLWVFCNPINADYDIVRRRTVMSPFESAVYMGAPNIIMTAIPPGRRGRDVPEDRV